MITLVLTQVSDYLHRYYKAERKTPTLLRTYTEELENTGRVCTAGYDNVTGFYICWPTMPEWAVTANKRDLNEQEIELGEQIARLRTVQIRTL